MGDLNAVALFCDDIREEKAGTHTLVGIYNDNVGVPTIPGGLPKLGIYVRVTFPIDIKPSEMKILFIPPVGDPQVLSIIDEAMISKSIADTKMQSGIISTIYSIALAVPFSVPQEGRFLVKLETGGESRVIGSLNFILAQGPDEPEGALAS